ncbi:MAG TPA: histidine phosphatase family protein [Patescibacteria group bacterium]|nr:histidine phosphatase family protein [Patescibacteria group bacterium]
MKQIYVIRHADKNKETGQLTDEGRERARQLKDQLGNFDLVITADRPRLTETALLLTGRDPQIDKRAGFVYTSSEQKERLSQQAKVHPMDHAGALFEFPEHKEHVGIIGNNLIELIKETFQKLPENGKALIVSQDGVMVAAERILQNKPYEKLESSYQPLEGYIIDYELNIKEFTE